MTESERLKLHIWSLHESRDGPAMAELRHMIAGMVERENGAGRLAKVTSDLYNDYVNRIFYNNPQRAMQAYNNPVSGNALHGPLYYGQRYSSD